MLVCADCGVQQVALDNKLHKEALQNLLMNCEKHSLPGNEIVNCGAAHRSDGGVGV